MKIEESFLATVVDHVRTSRWASFPYLYAATGQFSQKMKKRRTKGNATQAPSDVGMRRPRAILQSHFILG
jgi:hypothetical protein